MNIKFVKFWCRMAVIISTTFATGVQSEEPSGCLLEGSSETFRAINCIPSSDGSTTILTLCDKVTRCKTSKKTIPKDRPCPRTTKPSQQANIFIFDGILSFQSQDQFWNIATNERSMTPCPFDVNTLCSSQGDEILLVISSEQVRIEDTVHLAEREMNKFKNTILLRRELLTENPWLGGFTPSNDFQKGRESLFLNIGRKGGAAYYRYNREEKISLSVYVQNHVQECELAI